MKTRSLAPTGPPYGRTAEPRGRARFSKHPPGTISRPGADARCREMFKPSLSFPSIRLEVPLWSEHWLSCLKLLAQSNPFARPSVDFPRRCPFLVFLSGPFQKEEFAVISRYFNSRYRDCAPNLSVKVPNRGVDWSSRPRRACYPWGNFSVTSNPQQWGYE
jgi:hypothetical protein